MWFLAILAFVLAEPVTSPGPVEQARALAGAGKISDAIAALRLAVERSPDDPAAHNMLGALLNREGRYREALVYAQRAAELKPGDNRYRYNRGIVLAEHGRFEEALSDFEFAIAGMPGEAPMYLERGAALLSLGRDGPARTDWANARRLAPDLVWVDWYEGLHDLIDGDRLSAAAKLRKIATAQPDFDNAEAWLALVGPAPPTTEVADPWVRQLLDYHGNRLPFEALLEAARQDSLSGDQRRVGEAWVHRGVVESRAGRDREAEIAFRNAIATPAPRHAWKLLAERELQRLTGGR